jgi:acyl-coenzyme A thioesterase PaaI-like protein
MQGKPVRESASEYSELALPIDANGWGHVLGGKVMHLVDLAGAMAAMRHARRGVVTAAVDSLHFLHPVHIGELIMLRSAVNRVFRSSTRSGRARGHRKSAHRLAAAHLLRVPDIRRHGRKWRAGRGCAGDSRNRGRAASLPRSRRAQGVSAGHAQSNSR